MPCITAQHINIITKDDIMVNHFCNNFDSICPFYWALFLQYTTVDQKIKQFFMCNTVRMYAIRPKIFGIFEDKILSF